MVLTNPRNIARLVALLATTVLSASLVGAPASAVPSSHSKPGPAAAPSAVRPPAPVAPKRTTGLAPAIPNQDGVCNFDELCLWYFENFQGSMSDFAFTTPHLAGFRFLSAGFGQGQPVTNNSESVFNTDDEFSVSVCVNDNLVGPCGLLQPGQSGNFTASFRNNVESFNFTFV
jgi:hypothetical protein